MRSGRWSGESKIQYSPEINRSTEVVSCDYFTTQILLFDRTIEKDYFSHDSFVIYIALNGDFSVVSGDVTVEVKQGETVLLPASTNAVTLIPEANNIRLLEVFIK